MMVFCNNQQSMGTRNRVEIGCLTGPPWLRRLAESILGIDFLESIPGLLKSLKLPCLSKADFSLTPFLNAKEKS